MSELASAAEIVLAEGWRPGAIGAIASMHAIYYAREWSFGRFFESKVACECAQFLDRYDPRHDRLLLALAGERIVGALAIDGGEADAAREGAHLRWFIVADECRGRAVGRRLMDAAMDFLHAAKFERCYLTTFAGLDAARALYERAGFRLVAQAEAETWGARVTEQRFEWRRTITAWSFPRSSR